MASTGEPPESPIGAPNASAAVPAVRLADVVLDMGGSEAETPFTVNVHPGESVAVVGGNGSGKSALVRTLLGLQPPRAGRVRLHGVNLYRASPRERAALCTRLGFVLSQGGLLSASTVYDNVALALRYHGLLGEAQLQDRVATWLDRLGIAHLAEHRPARLSVGEARRVALARALVHEPDLLIFDEPFAGLDDATSEVIFEQIQQLRERKVTKLFVTLAGNYLNRLVERHYQIERGVVRAPNPGESLASSVELDLAALDKPASEASSQTGLSL